MIQKIDGTAWTLTAVAGLALLSLAGDRSADADLGFRLLRPAD